MNVTFNLVVEVETDVNGIEVIDEEDLKEHVEDLDGVAEVVYAGI